MDNPSKLIIGLGNPGAQYDRTRHNIGFEVVDALGRELLIPITKRAIKAVAGEGMVAENRIYLLKPHTYMNLSGDALGEFIRNRNIDPARILVVADDINLAVGRLRLRPQGSAGGHNGLKSIIARLQSQEFPRLRVGVGGPPSPDRQIDFVLSRFAPDERKIIDEAVERAVSAVRCWITDGVEPAMNRFNS